METFSELFENKVEHSEEGCLLWSGSLYNKRYGRLWFEGKDRLAHRVAWELNYGPIPKGVYVCHTCDVLNCVEPTHLFLGTPQDNMTDKVGKNRQWRPKGEKHPSARLTENDIRTIRADERSKTSIAKEYGVSRSLVSLIKSHKRWAHVTD